MTSIVEGTSYVFSAQEWVTHRTSASEGLDRMLARAGSRRAYLVCSRTLNTRTEVIRSVLSKAGDRVVGLTDKVGEHSPLSNVLAAAKEAQRLDADVLVAIGGGSVMDMCKAMQLCISEQVFEREALLRLQMTVSPDGEMLAGAQATPRIRQIAIPTTFSTAEWTPVSTPVDDTTRAKARFLVPGGAPRGIVYDPDLSSLTPLDLLLATGVRGLDHAINTLCSTRPHPFASALAEKAIQLYMENLPRLKQRPDPDAVSNCQLATWYTGMGQMSVPHGFSHWMVHIVGPLLDIPHSRAACVLMLAQARWMRDHAAAHHARIVRLLDRDGDFPDLLPGFLMELGMPTSWQDLDVSEAEVESLVQPALKHPQVTRHNLRPISSEQDLRCLLRLAGPATRKAEER